jgi:YD repeat-containing protein
MANETACESCNKHSTPTTQQPISLATGNTYIDHTDVSLPGRGGGITVTRTWNSLPPPSQPGYLIGMFGANWRSTYEEQVFVGTDHYMKYARGDGSFWSLGYSSGSPDGAVEKYRVVAPAFVSSTSSGDSGGGAELAHDSTTSANTPWTFTFGDGEKRLFDSTTGYLTTIIDRNGNTTTINRDSIGRITSVSAPGGRSITFTYGDATNPRQATSVDDGCTTCAGGSTIATYQYIHDGSARLQKVTYADGSSENFQYNDPHANTFISAVVDGAGKVLEAHTYDANGRGTSGSQAQGVNGVTLAYPQ